VETSSGTRVALPKQLPSFDVIATRTQGNDETSRSDSPLTAEGCYGNSEVKRAA